MCLSESHRKGWVEWQKKLVKMESLQVEFEVAVEGKPELQKFLEEVNDKMEQMILFKKTFLKFWLGLEGFLKKSEVLPDMATCRHEACCALGACIQMN